MRILTLFLLLTFCLSSYAQSYKEIIVDPEWAEVTIKNSSSINFGNGNTEISYSIFINEKFFTKFRAPMGWRESIIESIQTVLDHAKEKGLVAKLIVKDQRVPMVMIEEHPEILALQAELKECKEEFDTRSEQQKQIEKRQKDLKAHEKAIMLFARECNMGMIELEGYKELTDKMLDAIYKALDKTVGI